MRTVLAYTLLRVAIFAACFGVLYLLFGSMASIWLVVLLALLFTSGLSLLLLRQQGSAAGRALGGAVQSVRQRIDRAARKEDSESD